MNADVLKGALKGTVLERIMIIGDKGLFREPSFPVGPGEVVIGDMTALEKAILTVMEEDVEKSKEIVESIPIPPPFLHVSESEMKKDMKKTLAELNAVAQVFEKAKSLKNLIFLLSQDRIKNLDGKSNLGIRSGFKIVAFDEPEGPGHGFFSALKEKLGMDCADCADLEACTRADAVKYKKEHPDWDRR